MPDADRHAAAFRFAQPVAAHVARLRGASAGADVGERLRSRRLETAVTDERARPQRPCLALDAGLRVASARALLAVGAKATELEAGRGGDDVPGLARADAERLRAPAAKAATLGAQQRTAGLRPQHAEVDDAAERRRTELGATATAPEAERTEHQRIDPLDEVIAAVRVVHRQAVEPELDAAPCWHRAALETGTANREPWMVDAPEGRLRDDARHSAKEIRDGVQPTLPRRFDGRPLRAVLARGRDHDHGLERRLTAAPGFRRGELGPRAGRGADGQGKKERNRAAEHGRSDVEGGSST